MSKARTPSKSRRGRGEGSVFFSKSKNKWIVRLNGKERSANTKAAAMILLNDLQMTNPQQQLEKSNVTVSEFLEGWYAQITKNRSRSTMANYRICIDKHIVPYLGGLLLQKLSSHHIEEWLAELDKQDVGQRTKQNVYTILKAALNKACAKGTITTNPCAAVERPKHEAEEMSPFTIEEMKKILKQVKGHRLEGVFQLAMRLGLRQGEIFGLKWRNVDFESRTLHIAQQAAEVSGVVVECPPKTKSGRRAIPLDDSCIEALNERRRLALIEKRVKDDDWVFPKKHGGPIVRSNFAKRTWRVVLEKAGVAHRGMHQCRHTAATLMLNAGTSPNVVARILGHKKASTTLDIYGKFIREAGEEAVKLIGNAIGE